MNSTTPTAATGSALDPEVLDKLEALARQATPGPWQWWTSNSLLRLTGADGQDGGVLCPYYTMGHADLDCSAPNQAFIAAANPATVLQLIALARRATQQATDEASLLDLIRRINDAVLKVLPRHPDPGVMQARHTKAPMEVLVNVESLARYFSAASVTQQAESDEAHPIPSDLRSATQQAEPAEQKTGREMYERWVEHGGHRRAPKWEDLAGSTQAHWNKQAIYSAPAKAGTGDADERALPLLPEMESLADLEYAQATPEGWDEDYRNTWQKLQVAERNKMQWRAYALQLRAALAKQAAAKPVAWIATDLDGRADVAFTKEEAKRRAGEGCTEFIPLHDIAAPISSPIGEKGEMRECPYCEGTQRISPNELCSRCDASGILPEDRSEMAGAGSAGGLPGWQPMTTAPKDGTMVRLLVQFEENATEDSEGPAPTIGANNFDHDGFDQWKFAGWCWCHDEFTHGVGTPIGWLPMLDSAPAPTAAVAGQDARDAGSGKAAAANAAGLPDEMPYGLGDNRFQDGWNACRRAAMEMNRAAATSAGDLPPYGYVLKTGHGNSFAETLDHVHPECRHMWVAVDRRAPAQAADRALASPASKDGGESR